MRPGNGSDEKGIDRASRDVLVHIDPQYFRPTEVDVLQGNPTKAHEKLSWQHTTTFSDLIKEMVSEDLAVVAREELRNESAESSRNRDR